MHVLSRPRGQTAVVFPASGAGESRGAGPCGLPAVHAVGRETPYDEFTFYFETSTPNPEEIQAISYIDSALQREDIHLLESVQRGMRTPAFQRGR